MSKKRKRKKKKNLIKLVIELLIALGTFLAGLASFIQVQKRGESPEPLSIITHLEIYEKYKV